MSRALLRATVALALLTAAASCGPARVPAGSPCTLATQCETRLCLFAGDGGGVCARRCTDTSMCTGSEVCGRFDFRPIDPDSGTASGADTEIVRVCRPPRNAACGAGQGCAPGSVCVGEPTGVCTATCTRGPQCASGRCVLPEACGAAGACAPACDDRAECPRGWFCNLVGTPGSVTGRCDPISGPGDDAGNSAPDCDASTSDP